jgi:hypothetical protein
VPITWLGARSRPPRIRPHDQPPLASGDPGLAALRLVPRKPGSQNADQLEPRASFTTTASESPATARGRGAADRAAWSGRAFPAAAPAQSPGQASPQPRRAPLGALNECPFIRVTVDAPSGCLAR